jgi:hypothetical protein
MILASISFALIIGGLARASAADLDLKTMLFKNTTDSLPEVLADKFIDRNSRTLFRWLSKTKKDAAHYPGYSNSPKLTFDGMKVWDANVRFENGTLKRVDLSLYNRGDAGMISDDDFKKLLDKLDKSLADWLEIKPSAPSKLRLPKNQGMVFSKFWVKGTLLVTEKWSLSKVPRSRNEKPEFITLSFCKFNPKNDPRKTTYVAHGKTNKAIVSNLKSNIKKTDDGGFWLDNVPMVDQGPKGYCVVAVMERILRYYGQDVDQHMMAELGDTKQGGGTYVGKMMEMLKKSGVKFRVKVKVMMESMNSVDLMNEMVKYQSYRKRKKLSSVRPVNGFEENYVQIKQDIETYKKFRVEKLKSDYKKFRKAIVKAIKEGIPLVWGVHLGLVPEEKLNPQTEGGHMRMIIGYNEKTNEIFYTDTWGAGHELKKMNWDDAWCETTSYSVVYPRKK